MIVHAHFKQKNGDDPTFEWLQARVGVVTASEVGNLVTDAGEIRKGEMPKSYLYRKLAETWQGAPLDSFQGFAMGQGALLESEALPQAELLYDVSARQVGFITTDDGRFGCSPDGIDFCDAIFNDDKPTRLNPYDSFTGLEIKCPELPTHIKYLVQGVLPPEYAPQVQMSMLVTGCPDWHFMAYRRKLPTFHLIVHRDEKFQKAISDALEAFWTTFQAGLAKLTDLNGGVRPKPLERPTPIPLRESENPDLIP
jgi:hypothetical protein